MKKALLICSLFTSICMASENIKEPSENMLQVQKQAPGERLEDWNFYKRFEKNFDKYQNHVDSVFKINSRDYNNVIRSITLFCYKDEHHGIRIWTRKSLKVSSQFKKNFMDDDIDENLERYYQVNESNNFSEFLEFFYESNCLSDCILNIILDKMANRDVIIKDFRSSSRKFVQKLIQFFPKNGTEQDFKTILYQNLERYKPYVYREYFIAIVIFYLHENNPTWSILIKELAQEIIDVGSSFHSQVKLIQSDIEMNDATEPDFKKRYLQALKTLLSTSLCTRDPKFDAQLDLLIKMIYNNGQLISDPLPIALQNFKLLDFDNAVSLLLLLSDQNQKIKDLEQQLKNSILASSNQN
ncbi:MAG: hypothetical protein ACRYGR_01160 [Janthinobacterium lividum]